MKNEDTNQVLLILDNFINSMDQRNLNEMSDLLEEVDYLEQLLLNYKRKINPYYINVITTLKEVLMNIDDNRDAIKLVKEALSGANKQQAQNIINKIQEKGINLQEIIKETTASIAQIETICKNYTIFRTQELQSNSNQYNIPRQHKRSSFTLRLATRSLAISTALILGSTSSTFVITKYFDDNSRKKQLTDMEIEEKEVQLKLSMNNMVEGNLFMDSQVISYKQTTKVPKEIKKVQNITLEEIPIVSQTVSRKCKPIISNPLITQREIIEINPDFSDYPVIKCPDGPNEHVYYRHAKSYQFSEEEKSILMKVVTKEAGCHATDEDLYIEAMAVASTILNRLEDKNYYQKHGADLISQLSAPSQFTTYAGALKMSDEQIPAVVKTAVEDTLNGVRNHEFVSFRANSYTGYGRVVITTRGNNHFTVMRPMEDNKYYVKK